jgi:hypothetical protein
MSDSGQQIIHTLLERHGRLFSEELHIRLEQGTPAPLFRWLCASILFSARISAKLALRGAQALTEAGWTTPARLAEATWEERTRVLNQSGYARYDERTSTMLGQTAELLLDRYRGDLRRLRYEAAYDPDRERARLKEFKGMGDVGVDIFFREVQVVWDELFPFADQRALLAASRLKLGRNAQDLVGYVDRRDFTRLVAALVRVDLTGDYDAVRAQASQPTQPSRQR